MKTHIKTTTWDGVERRKSVDSCRRRNPDRRTNHERRHDPRSETSPKRSLKAWIRSLMYARVGVDRRKGVDQRMFDRRCSSPRSLLTQEELNELLK